MMRIFLGLNLFLFLFLLNSFAAAQSIAHDDFYVVDRGQFLPVTLNDTGTGISNPLMKDQPSHGSAQFYYGNADAYFVPISNYSGFDSFTYRLRTNPVEDEFTEATVNLLLIGNDDTPNGGPSCSSVGKPVNVTNGNMWLEQADYSLPGIGETIQVNRFYNSIIQTSGLFGFGWSTKYDESLQIYPDDKMIKLNEPTGKASYFGRSSTSNPFTSFSPNVTGQIVKNADGTFILTYNDGRAHEFDSTGRLLWQKDRAGNQTTLNYNANGILTGVTDAAGQILAITIGNNGNVSQISDPLGTVATYTYIPSTSLLETVTYSDGSKFKFEYVAVNGKTYIKTVKDALDKIIETHDYDPISGKATSSEKDGGVEKYTINYVSDPSYPTDGQTTVTDARGKVTNYYYTRMYGTNLVTRIDGNCSCGSGSQSTTFTYDVSNSWLNLVKKTDALGHDTVYTYDGNRNVISLTDVYGTQNYTYNGYGEVLTYQDRIDSSTVPANNTIVNTYDPAGNLATISERLSPTSTSVTTINYPATNNQGIPDSITDARQNVTQFTWFASGLLKQVKDPYLHTTNYTYDARSRLKTVIDPMGHLTTYNYSETAADHLKVEYIYPNSDKITYQYNELRLLASVTDEREKTTTYEYDTAHRLKKVIDPLGHHRDIDYDLMSNVKLLIDAAGNQTDFIYDDFNRLKEIDYPAETVGSTRLFEKFDYDNLGRIFHHYDTANRVTTYGYNDMDRVNTVTNAQAEVTETTYNKRFQTVQVKDAKNPNKQVYDFTYDLRGLMLSETRGGQTMSFTFDKVGNPESRTDYMGRLTNYTFDKLDRLTNISYGAGGSQQAAVIYGYDDASKLTSASNEAGTLGFTYDPRNRLAAATDVFGHVVGYEYERTSLVNQRRLKLDGSLYATYNFDNADRLANIVNASDSSIISFQYENDDRIKTRTYPNGVSTTYEYDNLRRLKRLTDTGPTATLFDRQYIYNSANQIGSIIEPAQTRSFGYDNVDRLTSVTNGGAGESYTYDSVGNRATSHLSSAYGYQTGAYNWLTSTDTGTYNHDANGNTTTKSEGSNFWHYRWDYENRLSLASTRKQTVRYQYDALGRRVSRHIPGGKENTRFTYDGQDVLIDDDAGTITKYINGVGIDNKLSQTLGSTASYFLSDHRGSTNGLTDSTGSLSASNSYDSFGNPTNAAFPSRYQFTGREFDSFSGLQYSRARYYDPKIGRFISEDPIGFDGEDINLFAYVRNSPMTGSDPSGLFPSRFGFTWHQGITQISLEGLASQSEIDSINDEQYQFDSDTQDAEYGPMHAMSRPGQSSQAARDEANLYVRNQICLARKLSAMGLPGQALPYLARAIHTLQDSGSPSHAGFQPAWSDSRAWHLSHYISESLVLPANAAVAQARTRDAYRYYQGATGYSRLPSDFFPSDSYDTNYGPKSISNTTTNPSFGGGSCGCE